MPRSQTLVSLAALISAASLVSCDASRSRPGVAIAPAAPFAEMLRPVSTVVLRTPPSSPIVGLSGLDRAADGRLVVTDGSDPSAYLFAADGRLLKVLG